MKYGSMLQGINRKTEAKLLTKLNKNTKKNAKKLFLMSPGSIVQQKPRIDSSQGKNS